MAIKNNLDNWFKSNLKWKGTWYFIIFLTAILIILLTRSGVISLITIILFLSVIFFISKNSKVTLPITLTFIILTYSIHELRKDVVLITVTSVPVEFLALNNGLNESVIESKIKNEITSISQQILEARYTYISNKSDTLAFLNSIGTRDLPEVNVEIMNMGFSVNGLLMYLRKENFVQKFFDNNICFVDCNIYKNSGDTNWKINLHYIDKWNKYSDNFEWHGEAVYPVVAKSIIKLFNFESYGKYLLLIHKSISDTIAKNNIYNELWETCVKYTNNNRFKSLAYRFMGELIFKKNPSLGIIYFTKALSLDKDNSENHFALGNAYVNNGNFSEGRILLNECIGLDKNNYWPYYVIGNSYLNEANINGSITKVDSAISFFKKTINLNSDYTEAYYNLAYLYKTIKKDWDSARIYCEYCLSKSPDQFNAHRMLGNIYFGRNYIKAYKSYTEAYSLDSTDYYTNYRLGLLELFCNPFNSKYTKSKLYLKKALQSKFKPRDTFNVFACLAMLELVSPSNNYLESYLKKKTNSCYTIDEAMSQVSEIINILNIIYKKSVKVNFSYTFLNSLIDNEDYNIFYEVLSEVLKRIKIQY